MSTRRHFLKTTAAASLTASAVAAQEGKIAANDRLGIATIGLGGRGTGDTESALAQPGHEVVAGA